MKNMNIFFQRIFVCMAVLFFEISAPAFANFANPTSLTFNAIGQSATFVVTSYGCPWNGIATSADTSIATVTPPTASTEPQTFTVTAHAAGTTTITVSYDQYGQDPYGYPCPYSGDLLIGVTVAIPAGGSTANNPNSGDDGDPVNTSNGELFFYERPDLDAGGPLPLVFQRYYASYLRKNFIVGDLGDNWRHNYEWSLHWTGNTATIISADGKLLRFLSDGSNNWTLQATDAGSYQLVLTNESGSNYFYLADTLNDRIYKFSAEGKLIELQNGMGASLYLTYDTSGGTDHGRLTEVNDGALKALRLTYDYAGSERKLYVVDEYFNGTLIASVYFNYYNWNYPTWLTDFTDENGGITAYLYQPQDGADTALLGTKRLPNGSSYYHHTQAYYTIAESQFHSGKVKTQTDRYGNVQTFTYDGSTTTVTDPEARPSSHTHNAAGSLTAATDKDGNTISIAYDANGRRSLISAPLSGQLGKSYHTASGKVASVTDALGNQTVFNYTARTLPSGVTLYDLTEIIYPDLTTESFTYDGVSGHLLTRVDQNGKTWSYTHNALGQILTETNPLGGVTTYTYDTANNLARMTDNTGNTTTFTYEDGKRLLQIARPDGKTRTFTKTVVSGLTSIELTNENLQTTTSYYDKNGNKYQVIDPLNNLTSFQFDFMDRLVQVNPPVGNGMAFTYDALGRIATMTPPNGNTVTYEYDAHGNVTRETDSIGSIVNTYDARGRLVTRTDETGRTTTYTYDTAGRLTKITDPSAQDTTLLYDKMGRVTSVTDALGNVAATTYDARGLPVGVTLAGGISTTYTRNDLGEITSVTDPKGNSYTRTVDAQGRIVATTDTLARATSYTYNNMNRVATVTYPAGLGTLTYTYDDKENIVNMAYSDATNLDYAFDANGRLISGAGFLLARDGLGKIIESNGIINSYNAARQIEIMTLAAGATPKQVVFGYDARGRVTSINDWTAHGAVNLTYDAAGRLLTIVRPNGITSTYTYDAGGRLATVSDGYGAALSITRDSSDRITASSRTDPAGMPPPTLTDATSTATFDAGYQNTAHTYDALGRLTNDGSRSYAWDLASRLSNYTESGLTAFTYDANGHVLTKTGGHEFVWNYGTAIPTPMVFRNSGADSSYNVFTPEGVLVYRVLADGSRRYFHFDESGNTWFVSDDAGAITAFYRYTPFGQVIASSGTEAATEVFTFQGRRGVMREGTSGLYYMRARYYDSVSGRFLSRDPIETAHPLTINPYQYAGNNPLMYTDPLGTNSHTNGQLQGSEVFNSGLEKAADKLGDVAESGVRTYEAVANATSNPDLRKAMQERASRLKNLNRGLKAAGAAGTLAGAYNEGMKMDKAQKEAIAASQTEAQRIMESWQRDYDVLDGKLKRKEITRAVYLEAKVAADKFWQNQLEANANRGFNEVMLETVTGGLRALWQTTGLPTSTLNGYLNWLSGEE